MRILSFVLQFFLCGLLFADEWRYYAGDPGGTRYSRLRQIDRGNVSKLRVAWTYHSGDKGDRGRTTIECTPIVVDGVMYITSPMLKAIALDAATGKEKWVFNPFAGTPDRPRGVNRGVTYWQDSKNPNDKRILHTAGTRLYALDAVTGKPIDSFGDKGSVELKAELDRQTIGSFNGVSSPGVIFNDRIILGSAVGEGPGPSAPGHVRAYDVRTGKRVWIFHTIPHPGEFGSDTWEPDAWKTVGGVNDWGGMSVDEKRGLVFLALGSPAFDFYGGQRLGQNLFGNSVVALDAATGKRIWHFQTVHHDLWDYDLPTLPMLARVGGRDAVVQLTKTAMAFVLDRETGKPLLGVEERPVPASDIPGEKAWPTQPFPIKPPPFSPQIFEPTNISPEARAYVLERLKDLRSKALFVPPSLEGSIALPGTLGGALWGGASFDPQTGYMFVSTQNLASIMALKKADPEAAYPYDHLGWTKFRDAEGYPAGKPPWGQLSAIDLTKGEIVWQVPLGEHKELTARGVPQTGTENFGGCIATAGGLIFIGATKDEMFRAFDTRKGKVLWETKLESGGYATPSTYMVNGKQYVVIAAGGGGKLGTPSSDAFVAFTLP
jgi:quinoprotein glucose dehydrogenase